MTDEQIVRTLAEFMGFDPTRIRLNHAGNQHFFVDEDGGWSSLDYLTSYDALAPVCKAAWDSVSIGAFGNAFRWWQSPPRALAEALATAILAAKEKA